MIRFEKVDEHLVTGVAEEKELNDMLAAGWIIMADPQYVGAGESIQGYLYPMGKPVDDE